jgi:hypothetical protein
MFPVGVKLAEDVDTVTVALPLRVVSATLVAIAW